MIYLRKYSGNSYHWIINWIIESQLRNNLSIIDTSYWISETINITGIWTVQSSKAFRISWIGMDKKRQGEDVTEFNEND